MYLTLIFCHTDDPESLQWLRLVTKALEDKVPIIINGQALAVVNVDSGAILVQRAPASDITSVLLHLRRPESVTAEGMPPPALREYASPED